jgi:hypothetical protein
MGLQFVGELQRVRLAARGDGWFDKPESRRRLNPSHLECRRLP